MRLKQFKDDWKLANKTEKIIWSVEMFLTLVFGLTAIYYSLLFYNDSIIDNLIPMVGFLFLTVIFAIMPWRTKNSKVPKTRNW